MSSRVESASPKAKRRLQAFEGVDRKADLVKRLLTWQHMQEEMDGRKWGSRENLFPRPGKMGNPIKLGLELIDQHGKQVQQQDQLAASNSLEKENPNDSLLSTKSRSEDHERKVVSEEARDQRQDVPRVSGVKKTAVQRDGESAGVVDLREDVKSFDTMNSPNEEFVVSDGKVSNSAPSVEDEEVSPELTREMEAKCAAYVRHDRYGTFGTAETSVWEKSLLGLALVTIVPIRVFLIFAILVTYYIICKICTISRRPGEEEGQENYSHLTGLRRSVIVYTGMFLSRSLLFVVGFYHIKVTNRTPDVMKWPHLGTGERTSEDNEGFLEASRRNPGAIVSNHISYLDILYHMSSSFPSFVAKRSVAKLPLVGLISKCMGCVYVQRESKSTNFKGVSGIVAERTRAAYENPAAPMLLLFPEGTTTNGDYLLSFKTGAFLAEAPVLPVILKYPFKRFSPAWETITGIRHVLLLLCQFVNHLEVVRLPVYYPTEKECADPKLYADNIRQLMSTEGNLPLSDIGLHEKRVYHAALAGKALPIKTDKKLD